MTFDSDFIDISLLKGFPPKIIWLKTGNTTTENIAKRLIDEQPAILEFFINNEIAFLEIE